MGLNYCGKLSTNYNVIYTRKVREGGLFVDNYVHDALQLTQFKVVVNVVQWVVNELLMMK